MQQRVELKRLRDEVRGSLLDRFHGILHGAVSRDHDRDDFRVAFERRVDHLSAVDPRQTQVGDQNVEGEVGEPLERLFTAGRLLDEKAMVGEPLRNRLAQRMLVVHDQQMFLAFRHLVGIGRYFDTPRTAGQFASTAGPIARRGVFR